MLPLPASSIIIIIGAVASGERDDGRSCVCAGWRGVVGTAVIGGSAIDVDGDVAPSIGAVKGLKFCLTDYSVHIDVAEHQRSLISLFHLFTGA